MSAESFVKWQPSPLMEWAKSGYVGGRYNLARSGVPSITDVNTLPGGPFVPDIGGHNEWGHDGLRQRIAEWYGTDPANILLAQGASQSNFLIAGALLSGGGTAIVETPIYEPILRGVQVWANRVIRLPRRKQDGYQPDPEELKRLITADTKVIMLTDLHNPTHVALESDRRAAIIETAQRVGAAVMIDEVFLPMIRRDFRFHGFSDGAISINSLGKSWGLDGLRIGWAVGPRNVVHRAYRLNNLLGVNQPYMTEDLACRILNSPAAVNWMIARTNEAAHGRSLFDDFLARTPELKGVPSAGGISALVELPGQRDDRAFAKRMFEEWDTVVFPGSYFECPGCLRVSFGGPRAEVAEGLNRLGQQARSLSQ